MNPVSIYVSKATKFKMKVQGEECLLAVVLMVWVNPSQGYNYYENMTRDFANAQKVTRINFIVDDVKTAKAQLDHRAFKDIYYSVSDINEIYKSDVFRLMRSKEENLVLNAMYLRK